MSDRLEDFVRQHREEFDLREPDPSVWLKINPANAPVVKEAKADALVEGGCCHCRDLCRILGGYLLPDRRKSEADLYSNELYMEMQETEAFYTRMVTERYKELKPFLASDPVANEMLTADLEELDQVYMELKNDLKDNISNPEVIEAMVLNYRIKLEILEDLLNQLKEKENQDYEKDDSYSL